MFRIPKRAAVPLSKIQKSTQLVKKNQFRRDVGYVPNWNLVKDLPVYNFNSLDYGSMVVKHNCKFVAKTTGNNIILFTDRLNVNVRNIKYVVQVPKTPYKSKIEATFLVLFSTSFESLGQFTIIFDDYGIADVISRMATKESEIYNKMCKSGKLKIICAKKRVE